MTLSKTIAVLLILLFNNFSFAESLRVGLVLDKGGKNDRSFNSSAYEGATRAQKDLKIYLKYVEATDTNALESLHRAFARRKYDLIIGIGFSQTEAVKRVSKQFPDIKFAIVDGDVKNPNVRSMMFAEHEGSFLVGALAAMKSKSGAVGYIGGMDIPLIRRFAMGYAAGAEYINPKIKVSENYVGVTGEAWNNPAKAKELALAQFAKGIDVIFVAAGSSGTGVFDAAEENGKFAIGVDSNQNWVRPGTILTSMLKAVDVAVYETIKDTLNGKFTPGLVNYGLANHGVDYTLDKYNEKLITPEMKKRVDEIKQKIIAGEIQVPDYYKKK